jgi:hypothetical protein
MASAETRGAESAVEEGRKILGEVLEAVLPHVQGVHVNASRGGVELALDLAREARRGAGDRAGTG